MATLRNAPPFSDISSAVASVSGGADFRATPPRLVQIVLLIAHILHAMSVVLLNRSVLFVAYTLCVLKLGEWVEQR